MVTHLNSVAPFYLVSFFFSFINYFCIFCYSLNFVIYLLHNINLFVVSNFLLTKCFFVILISCSLRCYCCCIFSLRAGSLVWGTCARQSWRRAKRAGERNGARKSEPARKPLNFEFRPCEVTSLNCQGIKYLTNTSEAKCKQTRLGQAVTTKSLSTCSGPNSFQYHRKICMVSFGNVWSSYKILWSVLEIHGRILESYG